MLQQRHLREVIELNRNSGGEEGISEQRKKQSYGIRNIKLKKK
jgi:hypothetical protein